MKHKTNGTPSLTIKYEKYIYDPVSSAITLNDLFTCVADIKFSNQVFKSQIFK